MHGLGKTITDDPFVVVDSMPQFMVQRNMAIAIRWCHRRQRHIKPLQSVRRQYRNTLRSENKRFLAYKCSCTSKYCSRVSEHLGIFKYISVQTVIRKSTLARQQRNTSIRIEQDLAQCTHCGSYALIEDAAHADVICSDCGIVASDNAIALQSAWSNNHTHIQSASGYNRKSNFRELIRRVQGLETSRVPDSAYDIIRDAMRENGEHAFAKLKMSRLIELLKENNLSKYYQNATQIWCKITGRKFIQMTDNEMDTLEEDFASFERVWPQVKPYNRTSFPNNELLLHKITERHGWDHLQCLFRLLHGTARLRSSLDAWYEACELLGWEVIYTAVETSHGYGGRYNDHHEAYLPK